jgi:uroporphyrinogen decarboxylase
MDTMTPRQRIIAAASNRKPDRVPKDLAWGFTPAVMDTFKARTGQDDPEKYFGVEVRFVGMDVPPERVAADLAYRQQAFGRYYTDLPADATLTEWGTAHVPGTYYHFTQIVPPARAFDALDQFETYPIPPWDEPWRDAYVAQRIAGFHGQDLAVAGAMAVTIFEVAWQIRGMEELFHDFRYDPAFAECLLDRITATRCRQARFFAEHDVDVLILGDDVSMQTGMLMSPATWRKWFKGRMRRIIESALSVKPGLPVFYHSDGNPSAIIPELIEIGVTILNPVQPECIDPVAVKQQYGNRLALWGTIGTQTTMPFGTPDDVRAEVKRRIETVGQDGGLILGPTHSLEPDVPWENIVALYEAIEEYGG